MHNMLDQFLSGLIPVAIIAAFVIYAVYVLKKKMKNTKTSEEE